MKSLKIQKWNDDMQRAILAAQKRESGTKLAAQRYSVPRSTLWSYLKKEDVTTKSLGHCPGLGVVTKLKLVSTTIFLKFYWANLILIIPDFTNRKKFRLIKI